MTTMSAIIEHREAGPVEATDFTWHRHGDNARICRALFCPEADGFSVFALRLPGVASQGDTLDEAIANIRDAFAAAIDVYASEGGEIPWDDAEVERPSGSFERWILVDG
jgi:predicted RNase H-like HicB family nuclease